MLHLDDSLVFVGNKFMKFLLFLILILVFLLIFKSHLIKFSLDSIYLCLEVLVFLLDFHLCCLIGLGLELSNGHIFIEKLLLEVLNFC